MKTSNPAAESPFGKISAEELYYDRTQTLNDIELCVGALKLGIEEYGERHTVWERLITNCKVLEIIDLELVRRKLPFTVAVNGAGAK